MRTKTIITVLCAALFLVSCGSTPSKTASPLTSAFTPTANPALNTPTVQDTAPAATSSAQPDASEKWMAYERALAEKILSTTDAFCEWEILGQTGQEVYVWAMCQITESENGSAASVPAVIVLGNDGRIESVKIPRDGSLYGKDIREMFPAELQDQVLTQAVNSDAMWSHILSRHKNPEPPLIVLSGAMLP